MEKAKKFNILNCLIKKENDVADELFNLETYNPRFWKLARIQNTLNNRIKYFENNITVL